MIKPSSEAWKRFEMTDSMELCDYVEIFRTLKFLLFESWEPKKNPKAFWGGVQSEATRRDKDGQ